MPVTDYGTFSRYERPDHPLSGQGIIWHRNDVTGADWYDSVAHIDATSTGLTVQVDTAGVVRSMALNADQMAPQPGLRVYHISDWIGTEEDARALAGKVFDPVAGMFSAPAPTRADVSAERDRRINGGFDFKGGTITVAKRIQTDPDARENIAGRTQSATRAIAAGAAAGATKWLHLVDANADPLKDFTWITASNEVVPLCAHTMQAMGDAAAAHKAKLIYAAFKLKAMNPIPADYATNETYWA
jgi:hypothetical protein